jgi:hypothetical protein
MRHHLDANVPVAGSPCHIRYLFELGDYLGNFPEPAWLCLDQYIRQDYVAQCLWVYYGSDNDYSSLDQALYAISDCTWRDIPQPPRNFGAWHTPVVIQKRYDSPIDAIEPVHVYRQCVQDKRELPKCQLFCEMVSDSVKYTETTDNSMGTMERSWRYLKQAGACRRDPSAQGKMAHSSSYCGKDYQWVFKPK